VCALLTLDENLAGPRLVQGAVRKYSRVPPTLEISRKSPMNWHPRIFVMGLPDGIEPTNRRTGGKIAFSGPYDGRAAPNAASGVWLCVLNRGLALEPLSSLTGELEERIEEVAS
jgi:hypothetical protein